jgi:hypothetical protein
MQRKILRLATLVLALAAVPTASADTPTTTTPSTSSAAAAASSTAPQVEYWVATGAVHFDYVSRDALCADAVYVFEADTTAGAINGVLPGNPDWPAQVDSRAQLVFSSSSSSPGASVDLTFQAGDIVGFAFRGCGGADYSYVAANNPSGQPFVLASEGSSADAWRLAWEDGGPSADFDYNDLVVAVTGLVAGTDATAGTGGGDLPSTDLSYPGGCSPAITASPDTACGSQSGCRGAGTRWGVANGQAVWKNFFGIVMWRYAASVRVCIDLKHGSVLAYDSETQEATDTFEPIWSYDNSPHWDVGPLGTNVHSSWVRVTDSFTGCPILGVPVGCNHETFSVTFNVYGNGTYSTTDRFS